jgi:hypothetical protein
MGVTGLFTLAPFDLVSLSHTYWLQMPAAHGWLADLDKGRDTTTALRAKPSLLVARSHHAPAFACCSLTSSRFIP